MNQIFRFDQKRLINDRKVLMVWQISRQNRRVKSKTLLGLQSNGRKRKLKASNESCLTYCRRCVHWPMYMWNIASQPVINWIVHQMRMHVSVCVNRRCQFNHIWLYCRAIIRFEFMVVISIFTASLHRKRTIRLFAHYYLYKMVCIRGDMLGRNNAVFVKLYMIIIVSRVYAVCQSI